MDMSFYKKYEPFFGSWRISKILGEGSFGKVFEIVREDFGETYKAALKIITVPQNESEIKSVMYDVMDEASVTEYFENMVKDIVSEFVLMSKLKGNSHIVSYEDHQVIPHENKIGWDILIRMELLTPLMDYAYNSKITQKDIIKLGMDMCDALELCQKRNIIHRDIKPENIFVSDDGHFKLGDFGIARTIEKTTSALSKKGTYTYMAPEVYKGEDYGSGVDIYSLGIVMYRLLNENRTPFLPPYPEKITHTNRENALMRRIGGERIPAPAAADGRLAEIVLKACAYDPKERYSSPMLMRQELEAMAYNREEAVFLYPQGDDVKIKSVEYIDDDSPLESAPTDNAFGIDDTVGVFHGKPEEKKAEIIYEPIEATPPVIETIIEPPEVNPPPKENTNEKTSVSELVFNIVLVAASIVVCIFFLQRDIKSISLWKNYYGSIYTVTVMMANILVPVICAVFTIIRRRILMLFVCGLLLWNIITFVSFGARNIPAALMMLAVLILSLIRYVKPVLLKKGGVNNA